MLPARRGHSIHRGVVAGLETAHENLLIADNAVAPGTERYLRGARRLPVLRPVNADQGAVGYGAGRAAAARRW